MHILGVVIFIGDVSRAIGHGFTSKVDVWGLLRHSITVIPTDKEIANSEVFWDRLGIACCRISGRVRRLVPAVEMVQGK